ncbi:MAG: hypothetical protein GWO24_19745, partial [Akkermansiaceae bacterium]|nr:hypothetical protein [Akkermansiaceae bacterium]
DGLPAGALTTGWSWRSAPVPPVFSTPGALTTEVTFPVGGTYVLEFSATDGELTSRDPVTYRVRGDPVIEFLAPVNGSQLSDR